MQLQDIILNGDVYSCIKSLENNSLSVTITSPPYWKQRDYGFESQIGQEETVEDYIGKLVTIFNQLYQKLKYDGVFFLNVGDKYLTQYGKSNLLQIPYRLAYHMVKDGWILEDIIIWYKTNHMPSSAKDRFGNTYEPVLVLVKNKNNIYRKKTKNILKIPLQQTHWKHTAVYPEKLVEDMLKRVELKNGDLILDPFAGTGTTAVVVKNIRNSLFSTKIYSVIIEKSDEFIGIIKERTGIKEILSIEDISYRWEPVKEEKLSDIESYVINNDKHGEVFIAENNNQFNSAIKGINTDKFKYFHREDAIYFFGVKKWELENLYYIHQIINQGFVLRNMIVVQNNETWYPIFMFAKNSSKVSYKFYIDRIRTEHDNIEKRNWIKGEFIGTKVVDIYKKEINNGKIIKILSVYEDGFPKIVVVKWNTIISVEFIMNPKKDEFLMEGLNFICRNCGAKIHEPYDPTCVNKCSHCNSQIWSMIDDTPLIEEPKEIFELTKELENYNYNNEILLEFNKYENKKQTASKFTELERINWGTSPGARKTIIGEYFSKMRLYRIDQATVAKQLSILKNSILPKYVNNIPEKYLHTIDHWFRIDLGGSIPIPDDICHLKKLLGKEISLLNILEKTALKFQTVKSSIKGKNPGDFIETVTNKKIEDLLKILYLPSNKYIKIINETNYKPSKKQFSMEDY